MQERTQATLGPWTVRTATAGDRDAILQVHARSVREAVSAHYTRGQIEAWAAFPPPRGHEQALRSGRVFVAEERGGILGYGQFDAKTGEVEATYVLPEAHGRGVGRALLAESEARAHRAGFRSIFVSASLNAVAFYERAGFEAQVKRFYELPGGLHLECMFMIKQLDSPPADAG